MKMKYYIIPDGPSREEVLRRAKALNSIRGASVTSIIHKMVPLTGMVEQGMYLCKYVPGYEIAVSVGGEMRRELPEIQETL